MVPEVTPEVAEAGAEAAGAEAVVVGEAVAAPVRVSVSSAGVAANGSSGAVSMSAAGSVVVFESDATNLVPGDTNRATDIFVRDVVTRKTTRVSVSTAGRQGNKRSWAPSVSGNGRFVVFSSMATNLVAGDTNQVGDVFVHDRQTRQTTRVSVSSAGVQGNGLSPFGVMAQGGRVVVFTSDASNLAPGGSPGRDVFWRDLVTKTTRRLPFRCPCSDPSVSGDGQRVVVLESVTEDPWEWTEWAGFDVATGQLTDGYPTDFVGLSADGSTLIWTNWEGGTWTDEEAISAYWWPGASFRWLSVAGSTYFSDLGRSEWLRQGRILLTADGSAPVFALRGYRRTFDEATYVERTCLMQPEPDGWDEYSYAVRSPNGPVGDYSKYAINASGLLAAVLTDQQLIPADTNTIADIYVVPRQPVIDRC